MIKVIQYGLGPIGNRLTEYLAARPTLKIVGAIDNDPAKMGRDVGVAAGLPPVGVCISGNASEVLSSCGGQVALLTTSSSLEKIESQLIEILKHGISVVSTCEELAYPWLTAPAISERIDKAEKKAGAAVLGTGVNPGFLSDFLPLAMTGVCRKVEKITVERVQDARFRRIPFQKKIGAGLTTAEFAQKAAQGTLRHVGLTESLQMIAAAMGWTLDRTEDVLEPIVADRRLETPAMTIEAGDCLGVSQTGRGWRDGREVVTLVFQAAIGLENPRDRVVIEGEPRIDATIAGGVNGDIATCAMVTNGIPVVLNARPGLRTMADIEPISCRA
jgi:4-hydroxy-tetrahydrodipicolinate reductase